LEKSWNSGELKEWEHLLIERNGVVVIQAFILLASIASCFH